MGAEIVPPPSIGVLTSSSAVQKTIPIFVEFRQGVCADSTALLDLDWHISLPCASNLTGAISVEFRNPGTEIVPPPCIRARTSSCGVHRPKQRVDKCLSIANLTLVLAHSDQLGSEFRVYAILYMNTHLRGE